MERIFELKKYNDEKAFKLAIFKMKGYVFLWYKKLKRNRVSEAKSKIKAWSKFKKHMDQRFLPSSYKKELYLKITTLSLENLKVEEYIMEFEQLQMRVG